MSKSEQPICIRDARGRKCKVPFAIMRQSNGRFMAVLNNYPINGSFPNSAKTLLETDVHGHMFDMEQWKALMWIPWPETREEDK